MSTVPGSAVRFGVFEVDLRGSELRKSGLKIRLQDQPFQVLALLLERPGEIVTREDLRLRLWSTDTFVDFDHGLNSAIQKLREALGDSADSPRFVETVPRRGYRFIAPVEKVGEAAIQGVERRQVEETTEVRPAHRRRGLVFALVVLALISGSVLWLYFSRPKAAAPEADLKITPLTSYPGSEAFPSFSPDGNQVAFAWKQEGKGGYDIYVKLVGSGEPLRLTDNPADDTAPAWSPDGRRIAFYRLGPDRAAIYSVASLGGSERKLVDLDTGPWVEFGQLTWSPDGALLAFEDTKPGDGRSQVFLLSLDTGETRRIVASSGGSVRYSRPVFSPDGRTLAFVGEKGYLSDLYRIPVAGGEATRLTFDSRGITGLAWTPDGRELVFSSFRAGDSGLWRISATGGTPERLAWAGEGVMSPAIARQGRRLAFARGVMDANIYRVETSASKGERKPATRLIASTRDDANPYYSPDGKRIVFASDRSGTYELWVCDSDGTNLVQLTSFGGPDVVPWGGWSPDGKRILFDSNWKGSIDVYVIDAEGGAPKQLTTHAGVDARGSWSPDGRWIYFFSDRTGSFQVWKVPAGGGDAVQVTKQGGCNPMVSRDGKFVYYAKRPGIWRVPAEGGEETLVLPNYPRAWQGNWAPVDDGIYFADWGKSEQPSSLFLGPTQGWIKFLHFATGRVTEVMPIGTPWPASSLSISPDGRSFLYPQLDHIGNDLVLVENFR